MRVSLYVLFGAVLSVAVFGVDEVLSIGERRMVPSVPSLFEDDANVIDLPSGAVRRIATAASQCPWVIMYYNSYCGHCRAYRPKFSQLAASLQSHSVPLLFGAVNCHMNRPPCKAAQVSGVPHLRLGIPVQFDGQTNGTIDDDAEDPILRWETLQDRAHLATTLPTTLDKLHLSDDALRQCHALARTHRRPAERGGGEKGANLGVLGYALRQPRPQIAASVAFVPEPALYRQDVAGAFFLTMKDEVPMASMTGSDRAALGQFLTAVGQALPFLNAKRLLSKVPKSVGDKFDGNTWDAAVNRAAIPYRGTETAVEWRTCRGSSWRERGLPCGLWSLYHAMVANAPTGEGKRTLDAIRGYVAHFFVCYECRQHFGQLLYELSDDASDEDAMLWLWRAHNQVNARLAQEGGGSSDPKVPKVQWPTTADCPACSSSSPRPVLSYLYERYSWKSILKDTVDSAREQGGLSAEEGRPVASKAPTSGDASVRSTPSTTIGVGRSIVLVVVFVAFFGAVVRLLRISRESKAHIL